MPADLPTKLAEIENVFRNHGDGRSLLAMRLLRLAAVLREQRDKYRRLIDEMGDGRNVDIAIECNWTEQDDAAALAAMEAEGT